MVVVCVTWEDSQTLSSVSDTAGGTWAIASQQAQGGAPAPIGAIAYCLNHPGGSTTITATLSGTANPLIEMDVMCFTPAASTSFSLDAVMTPVTGTSSATFTGTSISTAAAGVVVEYVAGFQLTTGVATGGSPTFTRDTGTENASGRSFAQYLLSGSAQSVTPGASWGAPASKYVLLAAAFKEVTAGPTINTQPLQQVAASGATATFTVSATASAGSLSYQWRRNGSNVGTNSASYTTGTLSASDNLAWFDCDVTDSNGTVRTQRAYLIVAPAAISGKALGYGRLWDWFNDVESTRNGRSFALLRKQLAPWNAASSGIQATVFSDWAFDTSANNVTTALTGSLVTVSAGTLTPVGADRAYGVARKPGPGVGPFNDNQFVTPPRSTVVPAVSPDVTAALTGSAVTVTAGTLTPATTVTLNGQAVTASAGTLTPSLSLALTGSAATVSAGTLTPTMALALSGAAATASAGTLTAAESLTLTGELVTVSAGTITANTGSDVSAALTGQAVTVSAGTLGVTADGSAALTGSAVAASAGTLTSAVAVTLNGQDVTASAGTLTAVVAAALSGQAVTVSAGTLGTQVTGDVVAALTGVEVTVSAGILVATGGDAGTQTTGINGGGGGGSIDRRVRRKLDRKLNKILDDVVAEVVYKNLVTEGKATEAAKVVKPFVETKAASVPEPAAVDWDALTRNAKAVGALLQMWRAIERQREIEADDEEWLMF